MTATVTSIAYRHPSNAPATIDAARIVYTYATRNRRSRPPTPTRIRRNARSSFVSFRNAGVRCAVVSAPLRGCEPPEDRLSPMEYGQVGGHVRVHSVDPEHPPPPSVGIRRAVDRLDEDRAVRGRPVRPAQPEVERPRGLHEEKEDGIVPGIGVRVRDRPPRSLDGHGDGDPAREKRGLGSEGL